MGLNFTKACVVLAGTLVGVNAFATDFTYSGVHYNVTSTDDATTKTVEVIPLSDEAKYVGNANGKLTIPGTVKDENGNSYTVTAIAANAFKDCTDLVTVVLPNSVTTVGDNAFSGCSKLELISCSIDVFSAIKASATNVKDWELAVVSSQYSVNTKYKVNLDTKNVALTSLSYNKDTNGQPFNLEPLTIGEGKWDLTEIAQSAIGSYVNYSEIVIPASVVKIACKAFLSPATVAVRFAEGRTQPIDVNTESFSNTTKFYAPSDGKLEFTNADGGQYLKKNVGRVLFASEDFVKNVFENEQWNKSFAFCTDNVFAFRLTDGKLWLNRCYGEGAVTIPSSYADRTVEGIGNAAFSGNKTVTSIVMPSSITDIEGSVFNNATALKSVDMSATQIQVLNSSFKNLTNLEEVKLPASLKTISSTAAQTFYKTGIKNFVLPEGSQLDLTEDLNDETKNKNLEMLFQESALESIDLSNASSLNNIPKQMFYNCANLKTVKLPSTLKRIGHYSFNGCTALESIDLPATLTYVGNLAFFGSGLKSLEVPASVTALTSECFKDCTSLASVKLDGGDNMRTMAFAYGVFQGCTALKTIEVGENIKFNSYTQGIDWDNSTDDNTVYYDYGYNHFENVPDDCKVIAHAQNVEEYFSQEPWADEDKVPGGSFKYWNIDGLDLEKVTENGDTYFTAKFQMPTVETGEKVEVVVPDGSAYQVTSDTGFAGTAIADVKLGEGVESIGDGTFKDCTSLETVELPTTLQGLGDNAFSGCTSLKAIEVPGNVNNIGEGAFKGCTALKTVAFSAEKLEEASENVRARAPHKVAQVTVPTIGSEAFVGATSLTTIVISESNPSNFTAADDAFVASEASDEEKKAVYENITLVVPDDAKTAYSEADVWKDFKSIKTESEYNVNLDIDEVATEAAEVSASNGAIDVTGVADGTVVEVFAINGAKVATGTVESGALQVSVGVAGIYVVRVDGKSFKVVLRK